MQFRIENLENNEKTFPYRVPGATGKDAVKVLRLGARIDKDNVLEIDKATLSEVFKLNPTVKKVMEAMRQGGQISITEAGRVEKELELS